MVHTLLTPTVYNKEVSLFLYTVEEYDKIMLIEVCLFVFYV